MPAGRPPTFETEEQISKAIVEYFEWIKGEFEEQSYTYTDKKGNEHTAKEKVTIREPEPPTITGLTLHIGFASRQSFYDYEKDGEFAYALKRARLAIEKSYEISLRGNTAAGAIFALKNFGWSDKQEIDQKTEHSGTVAFSGIQIIKPNDSDGPEVHP